MAQPEAQPLSWDEFFQIEPGDVVLEILSQYQHRIH